MIDPKYGVRCLKVGFQRYRRYCKLPVSIELSPNTVSFYLKKPSEERGKNARVSNHHLSMERYAEKNEPWLSDNVSIEFIVPNSEEDKEKLRARVYQNAEGSIKPFDVTTYQYDSNAIEPNDIIDIFKAIITFLDGLGYSDPFVNDPKKAAKVLPRHSNIKPYKPMSTNISVDKDGNYVFANGDGVDFVSENNSLNCNRNMNKKLIRLTESDLHRIVRESVNKVLNEVQLNELDPRTYASARDKQRQLRTI